MCYDYFIKKIVLAIFSLAVLGALVFLLWRESIGRPVWPQAIKTEGGISLTQEETLRIGREITGADDVTVAVHDLNGDWLPEVVAGATRSGRPSFAVASILDSGLQYKKIGEFADLADIADRPVRFREVKDINGDGVSEVIVAPGYGGAYTDAEGIISIDFQNSQVRWLPLHNKSGKPRDAVFYVGASVMNSTGYQFFDFDRDGALEIVELSGSAQLEAPKSVGSGMVFKSTPTPSYAGRICGALVYKWNGTGYMEDAGLLSRALSMFDDECVFADRG